MFRRRFLQLVTMASVVVWLLLKAWQRERARRDVPRQRIQLRHLRHRSRYHASQQKGITSSKSTYPEGKVTVGFDPHQITGQAIVAFITDLGFRVEGNTKARRGTKTFSQLAATLAASLDLQQPPVAISFTDTVPSGVKSHAGHVPAGCKFWQDAASKFLRLPPPTTTFVPLVCTRTIFSLRQRSRLT